MISLGYRYRAKDDDNGEGEYTEIAKGSPQWPQAFYPAKGDFEVKDGDYLVARDAVQRCRDISHLDSISTCENLAS